MSQFEQFPVFEIWKGVVQQKAPYLSSQSLFFVLSSWRWLFHPVISFPYIFISKCKVRIHILLWLNPSFTYHSSYNFSNSAGFFYTFSPIVSQKNITRNNSLFFSANNFFNAHWLASWLGRWNYQDKCEAKDDYIQYSDDIECK